MSKLNFSAIKSNRFRFVCFPILLLAVGFIFAAQLSRVNSKNLNPNQSQNQEIISKQVSNFPLTEPTPETPHNLVGAFYDVENFPDAKLLLNNKGIKPLEVRPTLYNLDGYTMEVAPVTVEANSFRMINLRD